MADRPRMHDWSDACEYMDSLEAEIERLRAALGAMIKESNNSEFDYDTREAAMLAYQQKESNDDQK